MEQGPAHRQVPRRPGHRRHQLRPYSSPTASKAGAEQTLDQGRFLDSIVPQSGTFRIFLSDVLTNVLTNVARAL